MDSVCQSTRMDSQWSSLECCVCKLTEDLAFCGFSLGELNGLCDWRGCSEEYKQRGHIWGIKQSSVQWWSVLWEPKPSSNMSSFWSEHRYRLRHLIGGYAILCFEHIEHISILLLLHLRRGHHHHPTSNNTISSWPPSTLQTTVLCNFHSLNCNRWNAIPIGNNNSNGLLEHRICRRK